MLADAGYEFTYRKVPQIPGYDVIVGRAKHSKANGIVDFSVQIRRARPYHSGGQPAGGSNPQPPVVRYADSDPTIVGNVA